MIKKSSSPKKTEVSDPGYDARQAPINVKLAPDEKIQFYRLVDIPFARELRKVSVHHPFPGALPRRP